MLSRVLSSLSGNDVEEAGLNTPGDRIRWVIEDRLQMKQAPFARRIGATPQMLSRWLADTYFPEERYAERIAEEGGVTVAWLRYGGPVAATGEPQVKEGGADYGSDWPGEDQEAAQALDEIVQTYLPDYLRTIVRRATDRSSLLGLNVTFADMAELPREARESLLAAIQRRLDATGRS